MAAALGSAASWAVGSILFKRLGEHLSSVALTLAKGAVSVLLLGVAVVLAGYEQVEWEPFLALTLSGVLGIALGDTFFFEALRDLGAHALIVLLTLGQVLTAVFGVLFLGETPTLQEWGGIALVMLGIATVLYANFAGDGGRSRLRGIGFGLLSVLCMSISLIIAKQGLESVSAIQATFIRMLSGTVGMFGFGLVTQQLKGWVLPFKDLKLVSFFLMSVAVVTFGGFWLSLVAIKYLDVAIANTLNSTEPIFVLPLAAIFLKERIAFRAIVGTAIAMVGIVLLLKG